jgi:hypothetical protein
MKKINAPTTPTTSIDMQNTPKNSGIEFAINPAIAPQISITNNTNILISYAPIVVVQAVKPQLRQLQQPKERHHCQLPTTPNT